MMMTSEQLERLERLIPTGYENRLQNRDELAQVWGIDTHNPNWYRVLKWKLAEVRNHDNGDGYVIVSTCGGGYWRTNDPAEIARYEQERKRAALSTLKAPDKMKRVLAEHAMAGQGNMFNRLAEVRQELGLSQREVVSSVKKVDPSFRKSQLSEHENGKSYPTPVQMMAYCEIYHKSSNELLFGYVG